MKLRNTAPGKANTKVCVNGTIYDLDGEACTEVKKQADIDKMLSIPTWEDAAYRPALVAEKRKTGITLLNSRRQPIEGQKGVPESGKEPATVKLVDPPVPDEDTDEEWPDPSEEHSLEYLKKMADAYEIKYGRNIGKSTLIKRINVAMFE